MKNYHVQYFEVETQFVLNVIHHVGKGEGEGSGGWEEG